ncbi:MAG: ABC transporter permease [Deltaproteobacteria bacterium]|nr:ABC transporter permease [Deltaproteobacteria bacterium]
MDLKRTWAISRKELIHIRRDPISLLQIILLPVLLLLLYGYALTFDIKNVTLAIYDQERSQLSEDFINQFRGTEYFRLVKYTQSYDELKRLILERRAQAGLMLPYDFSWQYQTGKTATGQALVDGTDSNTANIVLGYIQGVTGAYNQKLLGQRLGAKGPGRQEMPVDSQTRFWFNEDLESRNYIVPGLIAVIMTVVGALLTALTVVRELENGSMEGLMATPLRRTELLLGKLGPYFIIGMFDMAVVMAMGKFLFQVPLRGSPLLLIALAAIFLVATLGQGLLISVTSENQLQAFQMAMLTTFLPSFLLSGFVFSIYLMPLPLQIVSYIVPARYLVTISKGVYLKGLGMNYLWPSALMLAAAATFFVVMSIKKFVKKIR